MDLLEYQAKELFRQAGIPILPSQRIDHPSQLKALQIPYPIVLKSQVRAGGRGKVGGVRFADNTIDAIALAQAIFGLAIQGERPRSLLAEVNYRSQAEYYLAILLDRSLRRPVLLGSAAGGMEIEAQTHTIQQVAVMAEFSGFYARDLALLMGLRGSLMVAVADVINRMYDLFVSYDLDFIEINPLGVRHAEGGAQPLLMALDGKIRVNPEGLRRHPHLLTLCGAPETPFPGDPASELSTQAAAYGFQWVDLPGGEVAMIGNGAGLTLATMDQLQQAGSPAANFLDIGETAQWPQIQQGLQLLHSFLLAREKKGLPISVVLCNFVGSFALRSHIQSGLPDYWQECLGSLTSLPRLVVYFVPNGWEKEDPQLNFKEQREGGIYLAETLDQAIEFCQLPRLQDVSHR
ncbi:MAG: ATP-grasp domain-containing protein [Cyanobacteriota bacterium]|nr:ATP-grasp domain-containing protein [Cyanobacteriota bacterium]